LHDSQNHKPWNDFGPLFRLAWLPKQGYSELDRAKGYSKSRHAIAIQATKVTRP
jgi:hypothetical protein